MLIQIVDDSVNIRETIKSVLGGLGATFVESGDGEEAVDCFVQQKPDLVIMDIMMEPMDGIAATRAIRDVSPGAKVIILTQYDDNDLRAAARDAGVLGYILKDDLSELLDPVTQILRSQGGLT